MFKKEPLFLFFILIFFLTSKIFFIHLPNQYIGDEYHFVPAAKEYLKEDFEVSRKIIPEHPPLAKIIISQSIKVFGDNPWGWRGGALVFGSLGLIVFYSLSKSLFHNLFISTLATFLLSLDFMYFVHSRIGMLDIFVTFFIILSLFFLWQYWQKPKFSSFLFLGLSFGLGAACKWSILFLMPLIIAIFINKKKTKKIFFLLSLSLLVYSLFLIPRFSDSGFFKTLESQIMALRFHISPSKTYQEKAINSSPAWSWFFTLNPFIEYWEELDDNQVQAIAGIGHPLVLWPFFLVFYFFIKKMLREKKETLLFVFFSFSLLYFPWFLVSRPTYSFYLLPSIPFICLIIAIMFNDLWKKGELGKKVVIAYLLMAFLVFVFCFPFLNGLAIETNSWGIK